MTRGAGNALALSASWWIDDYDSFTRSIRTYEPIAVARNSAALKEHLEQVLREVLAWKRGAWTQVATGYKGIWDTTWTKAQFEQLANQWPRPK